MPSTITQKQYLDYAGLQEYDRLLKTQYINTVKTLGIKTVLWDSTAEQIKFYKKPNAELTDTADFFVAVSSSDVVNLKTRVGMDASLNAYAEKNNLTEILNILTAADTVDGSIANLIKAAIEGLDTEKDVTIASVTDGVVTLTADIAEEDGIIKKGAGTNISLAKVATTAAAEDVNVATAGGSASGDQAAWALAEDDLQGTLETLAKVDANEQAAIDKLNANVNTEGSVLKSIKDNAKDATYDETHTLKEKIAEVATQAEITVEKQATAEDTYIATYHIKQNGIKVGDSINIPKDYLVKSAELKTCTEADKPVAGYKAGDKYIDFTINTVEGSGNESHIYINVNELYDGYTSGSEPTDEVVVVVNNDTNKISATVTDGTIARTKITSEFEGQIAAAETALQKAADGTYKTVSTRVDEEAADATYSKVTVEGVETKTSIKQKIDSIVDVDIPGAINALDSTKGQTFVADDVTTDVVSTNTGLAIKVVETDGKITSIEGSIDSIPTTGTNSIASLFAD